MKGKVLTKTELLSGIERNWKALTDWLAELTEEQLTQVRDPQGWSVKDHLIHISRWERWAVFYLQGKPCHLGVGVDESLYRSGPFDAINAVIFQQTQSVTSAEALDQLRQTHQQLLESLTAYSDIDLQNPYCEAGETVDENVPPAANVLAEGTVHHYAAHLEWMKALADRS